MEQTTETQPRADGRARAMRTIAWGYLFLMPLPLSLFGGWVGIEMLPDVVGWLIFWSALRHVPRPRAAVARRLALAGVCVAAPRLIMYSPGLDPWRICYFGLYMVSAIAAVAFTWRLGAAVGAWATEVDDEALARACLRRRGLFTAYLLLPAASVFLTVTGLTAPIPVLLLLYVVTALSLSMMMGICNRTARTLERASAPAAEAQPADATG